MGLQKDKITKKLPSSEPNDALILEETDEGANINRRDMPFEGLPRDISLAETLGEEFTVPAEIRDRLPMTPDHIEEARIECVYSFLEKFLLPRMRHDDPLEVDELIEEATQHKERFRQAHPQDLIGDFELITAAELKLVELHVYYRSANGLANSEAADLVKKGLTQLKPMLDTFPEMLYII